MGRIDPKCDGFKNENETDDENEDFLFRFVGFTVITKNPALI